MKSFAALLIKDLRAVRGWIVVIWALLVAMLLCPQRGAIGILSVLRWSVKPSELGWPETASWLSIAACFILIFMQRAFLKVDPPRGDDRFIGTRPVRGGMIFGSKLAAVLVGGILPVCLASAMRITAAGLDVSAREAGILMLENAWMMLSLLGLLSLRHVLPGNSLWSTVLGSILAVVILPIMATVQAADNLPEPFNWILAALFTLGISCWAGLAGRYGRWRGWLRILVIPGVWLIAVWMNLAWHHDFTSSTTAPAIKVSPSGSPNLACVQMLPRINAFMLSSSITLSGLPPGTWVEPVRCEGTFRRRGETREQAFSTDARSEQLKHIPIWAAMVAAPFGSSPNSVKGEFTLACSMGKVWLPPAYQVGEEGKLTKTFFPFAATVRGIYRVDLYRAVLEKQLPMERGIEWHGHHQALWIQDVEIEPDRVSTALRIARGEAGSESREVAYSLRLTVAADSFRASGVPFGLWGSAQALGAEYAFFEINEPRKMLLGIDTYLPLVSSALLQRRHQLADDSWSFRGERWPAGEQVAETAEERLMASPPNHRQSKLGVFRRVKIGTVEVPFEYADYHLDPVMNSEEWR